MQLKDLISALEELYKSYTDEYKNIAGEPEMTIDLYQKKDTKSLLNIYIFKGITPNISVRRSYDGSTLILTAAPVKKKINKHRMLKGRR